MKNIRQTSEVVKQVLTDQPETRNSDDLLYVAVCAKFNGLAVNLPFHRVMLNRKELNIPPFESVRRSRQKIQAEYPELAGQENISAYRRQNEAAVRKYAKG